MDRIRLQLSTWFIITAVTIVVLFPMSVVVSNFASGALARILAGVIYVIMIFMTIFLFIVGTLLLRNLIIEVVFLWKLRKRQKP